MRGWRTKSAALKKLVDEDHFNLYRQAHNMLSSAFCLFHDAEND
ncbi:hypothetical protein CHCC14820_2794 [Bacillus paralicheniformis]|nr:hypothetical protein CHCC20347_0663 [Bacillus paralicheniformis]TWM36975.1 hypothetical protein CHCC14820_2794 [Bacillus paralicheniformis]